MNPHPTDREAAQRTNPEVERWIASPPPCTHAPETDWPQLHAYLKGESLSLAQLPSRGMRTTGEQALALRIRNAGMTARATFLAAHGEWVYDSLTQSRTKRLRIDQLVANAAVRFPLLTPSSDCLLQERSVPQPRKEGWEMDQGLLLSAVLRSPAAGAHLVETMLCPTDAGQALASRLERAGRLALDTVSVERIGSAAWITVNNAACLNAEDDQLIDELQAVVDAVHIDPMSRVCVMRGGAMTHPKYAGRRVFSAGINLRKLHAGQISFVDFLMGRELGYIHKIYRGIRTAGVGGSAQRVKPWIAAVDGFAIGGGAQLLLVFDKVIAASDSYLSLPAANEGIVPGVANLRLTRFLGPRLARQVILGGKKIYANSAEGRLVFDEVCDSEDVEAAVQRSVMEMDNPAVTANKRMLTFGEESIDDFREYMAHFAFEQVQRMYSPDVHAKALPGHRSSGVTNKT